MQSKQKRQPERLPEFVLSFREVTSLTKAAYEPP